MSGLPTPAARTIPFFGRGCLVRHPTRVTTFVAEFVRIQGLPAYPRTLTSSATAVSVQNIVTRVVTARRSSFRVSHWLPYWTVTAISADDWLVPPRSRQTRFPPKVDLS